MKDFISAILAFILMVAIAVAPSIDILPEDGIWYRLLTLIWVALLFPLIGYYYDAIRQKLGE
jgi:hypothetical protein